MRCHVVAVRLLPGQPRSENAARAHERAPEKRAGRRPVFGTASARGESLAPRPTVTPPTQGGRKPVQRFQWHGVVLHQRRFTGSHQILAGHTGVLPGRESRRIRESSGSSVSTYILLQGISVSKKHLVLQLICIFFYHFFHFFFFFILSSKRSK